MADPIPLWTAAPPLPESPRRGVRRLGRRFAVAALALALFGVNAGLLAWLRPFDPPYFVPLWVTQYRPTVLPNRGGAEADRDAVQAAGLFPRAADTYSSQESVLLVREFDQLAAVRPGERLVVYLSGYVMLSPSGELALIPADVSAADLTAGLPLRDLLRKVQAAPSRRKLLVLDLAPPPPDPRVGFVRTDQAAAVPRLVREVADEARRADPGRPPSLRVLYSAEPWQEPQASRVLGRTAFGLYFEEGLRGAAAGHGSGRRVSVRGLAAYLRARVDRWSQQTRAARQTPALHGDGPDFDLAALPADPVVPPPPIDPAAAALLADGWRTLSAWRADGSLSLSPRLFNRLQDAVIQGQQAEATGLVDGKTLTDLKFVRDTLVSEMAAAADRPRPGSPASLALAEKLGAKPDPAAGAVVDALLVGHLQLPAGPPAARQAGTDKLIQTFLKGTEGKSDFAVEEAVFSRAAGVASDPDRVALLARALTDRKVPVTHVEARFLVRLGGLAGRLPAGDWPAALAADAVAAVSQTEAAFARPELGAWAGPALDRCGRARWEGETLLQYWGDFPPEDAGRRFRDAARLGLLLVGLADTIAAARLAADDALTSLPAQIEWVARTPDRRRLWDARLAATAALVPLLAPPPQGITDDSAVQIATDRLRGPTEVLLADTTRFARSAGGEDVSWLLDPAALRAADPDLIDRIDTVLLLPRLPDDRRQTFTQVRRELATRLNDAARLADRRDDAAAAVAPEPSFREDEASAAAATATRRAVVRVECHLALLRLAGVAAAALDPLAALLRRAEGAGPESPLWSDLGFKLAALWGDGLRDVYATADAAGRDTVAALFPGFQPNPEIDSPPAGPRGAATRAVWEAFFIRLAGHYRAAARAGLDADFLSAAAAAAETAARPPYPPPAAPAAGVSGPPATVTLTADRPAAEIRLVVRQPDAAAGPPQVRPLVPDGPLRVTVTADPYTPDPAGDGLVGAVRVRAEVAAPAATGGLPTGFVLEVRSGGRSTFSRVAVDASRLARPLELVIDRVPADPVGLPDDVRLRPGSPQPLYVFVRNTSAKPRQVLVRLSGRGGPLAGGTATVTAAAGETVLAAFPPAPPAAPAAGLSPPTAMDSLTVEAADAAAPNDALASRTLRLRAAEPFDYVQLADAEFSPPAPPDRPTNRLRVTVRARRDLGDVPCQAELVLDPAEVPGLRGVRAGRLLGRVPSNGQPVTLDATGLLLDPEADPRGVASITVDGVPRVFRLRVDFARRGDPTAPTLDPSPYLELKPSAPPVPGRSVGFVVGADRAPAGATLDVRLLREERGRPPAVEQEQRFPAARRERATVRPGGPGGAVLVTAALDDWQASWDLPQVIGRRVVQARLLGPAGDVLATRELPVVLDDTPPDGVAFRDPPKLAQRDQPLALRATAADPESGVSELSFFLGGLADGKPPATAVFVPGVRSAADPTTWAAAVPLPLNARGPTAVSVRAVNGAGLTAYATTSVDLVEALPVTPGSVAGRLLLGAAPQSGLEVRLLDARGTVLQRATTDADGKYRFAGLKAGSYRLAANKVNPARSATATVQVSDNKETAQDLSLYLTGSTP